MGANKTFQQKGDRGRMIGESEEFRKVRRAIEKAHGDRDRAIRNVCRLYGVKATEEHAAWLEVLGIVDDA